MQGNACEETTKITINFKGTILLEPDSIYFNTCFA